jgi:very-short-patch-repair endonuclease
MRATSATRATRHRVERRVSRNAARVTPAGGYHVDACPLISNILATATVSPNNGMNTAMRPRSVSRNFLPRCCHVPTTHSVNHDGTEVVGGRAPVDLPIVKTSSSPGVSVGDTPGDEMRQFRSWAMNAHFVRMDPTLRAVAALAETQHGLVSIEQAHELGASKLHISRWTQRGQIQRLSQRSITFPGQPGTWRRELQAALFDAGESAIASHRSAAHLHGFDGFGEGPIEVITNRIHKNRVVAGIVHTPAPVPLRDRCTVDGFRCTTAARTIVDLAAVCTPDELENAVDSAIRLGGTSVDFLLRRHVQLRGRGRYGGPNLDAVLLDVGGTNKLERRFLRLCRLEDLPKPKCQIAHKIGSQTVARVDFDFAPSPLVVEVEGQVGHASSRQRQRDAKRRRELLRLGRVVLSFTYEDVFQRPDHTIRDVRKELLKTSLSPGVSVGDTPGDEERSRVSSGSARA